MIPDFPEAKLEMLKFWNGYFKWKVHTLLGFVDEIPSFRVPEGDRSLLTRADGTTDDFDMQSIEGSFSVTADEIPTFSSEQMKEKVDAVAQHFADSMSDHVFTTLNRSLNEAGQTIDAHGQPLNKDLFLEMLSKIQIDFDKKHQPILPTVVVAPQMAEQLKQEILKWEQDDDFRVRHDRLIEEKRAQWHVRESSRKLVD